jgi:hypothetical protein
VLLLYFIFKTITRLLHTYALDKKRTIWLVTHPITKYHIHVPGVSFLLKQVVLAASGLRLVQLRLFGITAAD